MSPRVAQIQQALAKLEAFKRDPAYASQQYAIDANLAFLKAAQSLPRYLWWLFTVAPRLDGSRLLELTDFPVEEWDIEMHTSLIEMQKRKNPGLITPLVSAIRDYIKTEDRDLVIANLGAGGMEVDRQVVEWALNTNHPHRLTIVAVDKSPITRKIADKNLKEFADKAEIVEVGEITAEDLKRMRENAQKQILIVMCTNDIFDLPKAFPEKYFDLMYHSLFLHHLNSSQQQAIEQVMKSLSKTCYEFDGYRHWPLGFVQSMFSWASPVFLNGTIISMARYITKEDIVQKAGKLSYYNNTAHYLRRF
jgi:hypothetical protein